MFAERFAHKSSLPIQRDSSTGVSVCLSLDSIPPDFWPLLPYGERSGEIPLGSHDSPPFPVARGCGFCAHEANTDAAQSPLHPEPSSLKSRLRSVEQVKEHRHAQGAKRIDERREQRQRRNQAPQHIEEGEDERPHQKSCHQNRSDQRQQRSIFECHGRSMNIASVIRNSGVLTWGSEELVWSVLTSI